MSQQAVYQNASCSITLVDGKILHIKQSGFLHLSQVVEMDKASLELIARNNIHLMLIDQSELKVLSKEIQDYLVHKISNLEKIGIKKVAILEPENIFAKLTVEKIHREAHIQPSFAKYFASKSSASIWLLAN
jgi:hypothetical protein